MEEPAETREETKPSGGFGIYALWAGVILVLYVLSLGPFLTMERKKVWQSRPAVFRSLYRPLIWGYRETPLHKPLGVYLHLWLPQEYDKTGDDAWDRLHSRSRHPGE